MFRNHLFLLMMLGAAMLFVSCDDDDTNSTVCDNVTCSDHGQCVEVGGEATCDCDTGYHADALTCVEDTGNTAPEFTSTPDATATENVAYVYNITCTDAEGDTLTLAIDTTDTCDGTLTDNADGTGSYTFTTADATATPSCTLAITCGDGTEEALQSATITVEAGGPMCDESLDFVGQFDGSTDATSINGGTIADAPWDSSYDAGIADLMTYIDASSGDATTVSVALSGVTVIATYEADFQTRMYVADGNGAIKMFLTDDATQIPSFVPKTGMTLSVTVTEVSDYFGTPQILAVDGDTWTVDATGTDVPVIEHTGGPAVSANEVNQIVRVTGTLTSAGTDCGGGAFCYDLDYGAGSTIVFRTWTSTHSEGTCITFVGPVTLYNGAPQLTTYGEWSTMWW
ncbi:hypothetical protein KKF84_07320 [Myxococcota bacterium]|nr:hypothetical protein [Myxococcota bacterium]MBU1535113.1 hypothetical protein [Myxococcota bacterium]